MCHYEIPCSFSFFTAVHHCRKRVVVQGPFGWSESILDQFIRCKLDKMPFKSKLWKKANAIFCESFMGVCCLWAPNIIFYYYVTDNKVFGILTYLFLDILGPLLSVIKHYTDISTASNKEVWRKEENCRFNGIHAGLLLKRNM